MSESTRKTNVVLALVAGLAIGSNPKCSPLDWVRTITGSGETKAQLTVAPEAEPPTEDRAPEMAELEELDAQLFQGAGRAAQPLGGPGLQNRAAGSGSGSLACGVEDQFLSGLWMPDLPVTRDSQTAEYLRFFASSPKGRDMISGWLERGGKYRSLFAEAFSRRGLPRALEAVAFVESGLYDKALSHAGAAGLWQLMPQTARAYGLQVTAGHDQRYDVQAATEAAATHLADLFALHGAWDLALAAYNAGSEAVVSRLERHRVTDFLSLAAGGHLPRETTLYVPKVFAVAIVLQNLDILNFNEPSLHSPAASSSALVNQWQQSPWSSFDMRQGYPRSSPGLSLSPGMTWGGDAEPEEPPLDPHAFLLDRVTGKVHTVTQDGRTTQVRNQEEAEAVGKQDAHDAALGDARVYEVQPGDALEAIARRQNVSVPELIKWNEIRDPSLLRTGQKLRIFHAAVEDREVSPD